MEAIVILAALVGCTIALTRRLPIVSRAYIRILVFCLFLFFAVNAFTPPEYALRLALMAVGLSYLSASDLAGQKVDLLTLMAITAMVSAINFTMPHTIPPLMRGMMLFAGTAMGGVVYLSGLVYRRLTRAPNEMFGPAGIFGFTMLFSTGAGIGIAMLAFVITLAVMSVVGFVRAGRRGTIPVLLCFAVGVAIGFVGNVLAYDT